MPYKDYQKQLEYCRERYKNEPEFRERARQRNAKNYNPIKNHLRHIKRLYNLSAEEYTDLVTKQDNKCAICGSSPNDHSPRFKHLHVDHDHSTNRVRGLLCFKCNQQLGWYEFRKLQIEKHLNGQTNY